MNLVSDAALFARGGNGGNGDLTDLGSDVTISVGKDAKEGTQDVKVKDAKGKEVAVKVKVKKPADKDK